MPGGQLRGVTVDPPEYKALAIRHHDVARTQWSLTE
jgi:hypothetical protein